MRYRAIFIIIGPFVLWSVYFSALYAVQGVGCRANWDTVYLGGLPVLRLILIAMFLVAVTISAGMYLVVKNADQGQMGINRIGRYASLAGVLSTVIIFPGVLWLKLC